MKYFKIPYLNRFGEKKRGEMREKEQCSGLMRPLVPYKSPQYFSNACKSLFNGNGFF